MTAGVERAVMTLPAAAHVAAEAAETGAAVGRVATTLSGTATHLPAAVAAAELTQTTTRSLAGAGEGGLRIGLLGNGDLSWGSAMVHDRLLQRGHTPVYIDFAHFDVDAAGRILDHGQPIEQLDALMVRVGARMTDDGMTSLRRLEADGMPLLSTPDAMELARRKSTIASTLAAAGLPHPTTVPIKAESVADDVASAIHTFDGGERPLVIKPDADMGGHGVIFQERSSQVSLRSVADALMDGGHRDALVAQEWLQQGTGRDLRAYFVRLPDGTVHIPPRGIERFGGAGKGQANLSAGGTWSAHELDADVRDMARRGADAFGLDFGSVDFVKGPRGFQVIEVNAAAGLEHGIPEAIGSPVDEMLADLAVDAARTGRVIRPPLG